MFRCLILLVVFLSSGCGYVTKGSIYAGRKIIIQPVLNKIDVTSVNRETSGYVSFPILIENKLTNEVVNRFRVDGQLKVVSDDPEALKLFCTVDDYSKDTLRYEEASDGEVKEQRLTLHANIKLVAPDGEVLIERAITGEADYFLSGAGLKSEASAQADLVVDTARRVSEAVLEEW
ncbi:MAG: hypothetical protein KJ977_04585 [Candidatus Omnitrophica bacterium]|nr:hypothetical protein [Candidatus Omnitrophota bacterium]MBU2251326.1 hypothetical protein [Candidatus Omnitrophota bacterium]MBU2266297.1 hypothetical protein [Candidatus Omnitrophota bacterium]MBU2473288.1 hypothetical protein [Candidatus Omnitrophota bacterium]